MRKPLHFSLSLVGCRVLTVSLYEGSERPVGGGSSGCIPRAVRCVVLYGLSAVQRLLALTTPGTVLFELLGCIVVAQAALLLLLLPSFLILEHRRDHFLSFSCPPMDG